MFGGKREEVYQYFRCLCFDPTIPLEMLVKKKKKKCKDVKWKTIQHSVVCREVGNTSMSSVKSQFNVFEYMNPVD